MIPTVFYTHWQNAHLKPERWVDVSNELHGAHLMAICNSREDCDELGFLREIADLHAFEHKYPPAEQLTLWRKA